MNEIPLGIEENFDMQFFFFEKKLHLKLKEYEGISMCYYEGISMC